MLPRSDEDLGFSANEMRWAAMIALWQYRSTWSRKRKKKSKVLRDFLRLLGDAATFPPARRITSGPVSPIEIRLQAACAEALEEFERIEPLVDQFIAHMERRW